MEQGVTPTELIALALCLGASVLLSLGPYPRVAPTWGFWILPIYLVMTVTSLNHDPARYFLTNFSGALTFTLSVLVGSSVTASRRTWLMKAAFFQLLAGACLDLSLDYLGWSGGEASGARWEMGQRGLMTSTSGYGIYLAPAGLWFAITTRSIALRALALVSLVVTFYHVVVFGQGRGGTLLIALGAALIMTNGGRAAVGVVVSLAPLATLGLLGFMSEAVAPLSARVESESFQEVDRFDHLRTGLRLVSNMDGQEALTGIWYKKVLIANEGVPIHNSLLDTMTRFGLLATAPYVAFFGFAMYKLASRILKPGNDEAEAVGRVIAIQMIIAASAGGLFANWRMCVVPGLCTGIAISRLNRE